jgi:hypothetical protein
MAVTVVNIIPRSRSGETQQDSEPNLTVNPANPLQMVASAFTFDNSAGPNRAPVYVSQDGGNTWVLSPIIPSEGQTLDITMRFATSGNHLYAGIIPTDPDPNAPPRVNILRTTQLLGPSPMDLVFTHQNNQGVDQPYIQALTPSSGPASGQDVVFVGNNDFGQPGRRTATLDFSPDAGTGTGSFTKVAIDVRKPGVNGQDAPSIRPVIHADGTVYGAFMHQTGSTGGAAQFPVYNIVVVRDDDFAAGTQKFRALIEPSDGKAGRFIATNRVIPFLPPRGQPGPLGQERIGSHLSIGVDPRAGQSGTVYIAWSDLVSGAPGSGPSYTIHLRRSIDKGANWTDDVLTIPNALNPAIAINEDGKAGFIYQQLTGPVTLGTVLPTNRWETHFRRSVDGHNWDDLVLASTPADTPVADGLPYLGDYLHLLTVEKDFYGIFSANNTPDKKNFPNGVTFQRNANFTSRRLLATDNVTRVPVSIDPFFFKVTE